MRRAMQMLCSMACFQPSRNSSTCGPAGTCDMVCKRGPSASRSTSAKRATPAIPVLERKGTLVREEMEAAPGVDETQFDAPGISGAAAAPAPEAAPPAPKTPTPAAPTAIVKEEALQSTCPTPASQ